VEGCVCGLQWMILWAWQLSDFSCQIKLGQHAVSSQIFVAITIV
jgi:hypothetical protein